jgi:DNA-binding winged helix-turn-helix (wHTH) protein
MDPPLEIRFDGWTLRRPAGELVNGETKIRLQTQPLQILEELLLRPGELVTREQLIARLWPSGVVDFDTALNSAVRRLRMALGDHAETPRCIETIPRRGYRFIGRVDVPDAALPGGIASAARSAEPVPTDRQRWPVAAAFLVILLAVAAVLTSHTHRVPPPPGKSNAAPNPEAQERFLRAQHFFQRRGSGEVELARKYFAEAVAIDPGFARAWAGLAGAYWIETVEGRLSPEQGLSKMRDAAERALELDPRLAEAHLRLAAYRSIVGDRRERDQHLRKALALEPDNPLVLSVYASHAAQDGRLDAAVGLQRRAVEADPLSTSSRYNLGVFLYLAGRLAEAKAEMLKLQELHPTREGVNEILGLVLILEGRFDEALELASDWPDGEERRQCLALAYYGLGRGAESDAALLALIESSGGDRQFRIAEVHAYRGDSDQAFEWLLAGAESTPREPWLQAGRRPPWMMPSSPFLQSLRSDPRWDEWVKLARSEGG